MNEFNLVRFKITFDFNFIENVDNVLNNIEILQKSFGKTVSYTFEVSETDKDRILYYLVLTTMKQIKIENLSNLNNNEEMMEVGTDKPLGSKSAIDEN